MGATEEASAWVKELEAMSAIVDALEPLEHHERERVIRWVLGRMGLEHLAEAG